MSKIFVTGDIHGYTPAFELRLRYSQYDFQKDDALICTGDVGIEYGKKIQHTLKEVMRDFPGTIYIMRGNHDNRYWANHIVYDENNNYYSETPKDGWCFNTKESPIPDLIYEKKYDNIKYIRDEGDILNIQNQNILFIPGAFSVDKQYRIKNGLPYESREQLTYTECLNLLSKLDNFLQYNQIDYIISHTCPLDLQTYFQDLFLSFVDQSMVDNSMEKFLDQIYDLIGDRFNHWYFGHYHDNRDINDKITMLYDKIIELGDSVER